MDTALIDAHICSIEALPTELIQRIALFLPCTSVLNFSFTSRTLHSALYDKFVFRRSATTILYVEIDPARMRLDDVEVEPWELESCASEASAERSSDEEWWPDLDEDEANISPRDDWDNTCWGPKEVPKWTGEAAQWYDAWPSALRTTKFNAKDWARIAFAVEKARSVVTESRCDTREEYRDDYEEERAQKAETAFFTEAWTTHDMKAWLPHLLALRHPVVFSIPSSCLQTIFWHPDGDSVYDRWGQVESFRNPSLTDDTAAAFSTVVLWLHRMELHPVKEHEDYLDAYSTLSTTMWWAHPKSCGIFNELCERATNFSWKTEPSDYNFDDIYALLLHMIFTLYPRRCSIRIPTPVLHRMPVHEVLNNPVPFRTPIETFVHAHLSGEEMVQHLTGEWLGFHTESSDEVGNPDRYPPHDIKRLRKMQFAAREISSTQNTGAIVEVSGHGRDHAGKFMFDGSVDATGTIILSKHFGKEGEWQAGEGTRFRGIVTPFGIVGLWEAEELSVPYDQKAATRDFYGNFWIWKGEWCV
jgi:hypothetical protein